MRGKATGERRRGWRDALLIAVSLAMVLLSAAPGLTQESNTSTGASEEPEAPPYQDDTQAITDEAPGTDRSPTSDGASQGDTGYGTPVSGDQNSEIGGNPDFPNLTGTDESAQGQQPDPGHLTSDPTEEQHDAAPNAARVAQQAAQEARQASDDAQAARAVPQSSVQEEVAQQAAKHAWQASEAAQTAAQAAQEAAARNDVQAAQEAAETAQRESGAAQAASQAVQQAIEWAIGTDVKDTYTRALQAARAAGAGGTGADPEEPSGHGVAIDEATDRDTIGGREITGKDAAGEAEPKEDASEVRSSTAEIGLPVKGGVPLFLGGGTLLAAAVFAAFKALRSWSRSLPVRERELLRPSGSGLEGESDGKDEASGDPYRRRTEKASRFTAPGV